MAGLVKRLRLALDWRLMIALGAALALRLLLWNNLPRSGLISDEGEYLAAASWLAQGRGFAWYLDYLWTRAPVYPLFLAAHLRLVGETLTPIYVTQTILSLVNVGLVYALAQRIAPDGSPVAPKSVPLLAALMMALYFPLAVYTQVLLSETVYLTLLLGGFLALADGRQPAAMPLPAPPARRRLSAALSGHWRPGIAGVLFGLATLTRSLTLFFLPLVALWLLRRPPLAAPHRPGRWSAAGVLLLSAALVIVPWTVYNSRLYGGLVVVDTSGAYNLLLGGRTAYDGVRQDAPTRDFVLGLSGRAPGEALNVCAVPYPGPLATQAARQAAMVREGLCLIRARPLAFVEKSLLEFVDFFKINYSGDERFTDGFTTGRLPTWYAVALFVLDDTLYVLALPLAVAGWELVTDRRQRAGRGSAAAKHRHAPPVRGASLCQLIGLWWLYTLVAAPLLFAINRFRLPLLPFAFIFAACALVMLWQGQWARLQSRSGLAWGGLALLLALVAVAPHAYLEPRAAGQASRWASYLGPHPSSVADTWLAIRSRQRFLDTVRLRAALRQGDVAAAAAALQSAHLSDATRRLGSALLAGLEGHYGEGLRQLPLREIIAAKDVEAAVVYGDLLRSMGQVDAARRMLGGSSETGFVDAANPVQWAWDWLHPAPTRRIDLAGDLDLGYIEGCYLGEGDASVAGTFRWCTDGARLRFPAAGTGRAQVLALRVDARGWQGFADAVPPVQVLLDDHEVGSFTPRFGVDTFTVALPPLPEGTDMVITFRTRTFIPGATRFLSQQGSQVGQVQRLGIRLDWAELRETAL